MSPPRPLVSVIIPSHNRRELLLRAVRSVIAQTWLEWELIVVDDCSTDGSLQAIEDLGDQRICTIVNLERRGGGYSRARGAAHACGQFIAFLDSDDYWLPHKLERQLAVALADGREDLVLSGPMMVSTGDALRPAWRRTPQPGEPLADFIYSRTGNPLQTSGLMISGELGRRVMFDHSLRVNQDSDYLLRLEAEGANLVYVNELLYVHDASPRLDRITANPNLVDESMVWYRSVSACWSPEAHCGYHLNDAALRYARAGRMASAFQAYYRGFCWKAGPYHLVRQLALVIGGGEMPRIFRLAWRRIPMRKRGANAVLPDFAKSGS